MHPPLDQEIAASGQPDDFDRHQADDDWNEASGPLFRWQSPTTIIVVAFIVTRLWLLLGFTDLASDIGYYGGFAQQGIDAHRAVYRDFELEYPPVAWWLIAMPRLIDSKSYLEIPPSEATAREYFNWYCPCFHLELCLADIVCLVLMFKLGKMMLPTARWVLPAAYTLMALGQPSLMYDRLDLVLLMFLLLAIYCWLASLSLAEPRSPGASPAADRRAAGLWAGASYIFLGLGISYKILPIYLVPFLLLADLRAFGLSKIAGRVLCLLVAALGPFLIYVPSAGAGVLSLFRYHGERPINLESIWSSMVLVARPLGVSCAVTHTYGGYNLEGDWCGALKIASNVAVLTAGVLLGLWALLRGQRFDRRLALDSAMLALINSTVLSHVFSPQYLIWLLPLALLLALNIFPRGRAMWCVFSVLAVAILALSGWIWPYHHQELTQLQSSLVTLAVTRSACLVALAALLNVCFLARYGLVPGRADREAAGALAAPV